MTTRKAISDIDVASRPLALVLDVLLVVYGLAAVGAMVLMHGFHTLPWPTRPVCMPFSGECLSPQDFLATMTMAVAVLFALDRILRVIFAKRSGLYFRRNWLDFGIIGLALMALAAGPLIIGEDLAKIAILNLTVAQVYILFSLVLRAMGLNVRIADAGIHPAWLLIGSFSGAALIGSGLLMLPVAVPADSPPLYYIDALFTSTSAVCVTGLVVRSTATEFTLYGQAVILLLFQAGGLGIMIFGTSLALLVGRGMSMRHSHAMGVMLATERHGDLGKLAAFVVLVTLVLELIGALFLVPMFLGTTSAAGHEIGYGGAIWRAVFHSASAFCNAGFDLQGDSLISFRQEWQLMGVVAPLIILGGIGFPVMQDVWTSLRAWVGRVRTSSKMPWRMFKLSLHSKIVLSTSLVLIVGGAAAIAVTQAAVSNKDLAERAHIKGAGSDIRNEWDGLTPMETVRDSLFQSISGRTAGFNTVNIGQLSDGAKATLCGLMIIGGSPAGTAGGMKTVTFALLVLIVISNFRLRGEVEGFRRSISAEMVRKIVTLATLYMGFVILVTIALCTTMRSQGLFMDLLFEACSACGTVGLSTGVTPTLNVPSKVIVILSMLIGRVGPLTLLIAMAVRIRPVNYVYPREGVIIG